MIDLINILVHKFDEFALASLMFFSLLAGEQRLPSENPLQWKEVSRQHKEIDDTSYDEVVYESNLIIDHCMAYPDDLVLFPSLSNAIQKLEVDGIEAYRTGDVVRQDFGSSSYISCASLNKGTAFWYIYDFSRYFPYSHFPKIIKEPDHLSVFKNALRPSCGVALVILAFFLLSHFVRKISSRIIWSVFLASLLFGLNLIIEEASFFGITMNLLLRMKLVYILTYIGESFLIYALKIEDKVHKSCSYLMFVSTSILTLGSLITNSPDTMQYLECQFMYIANSIVGVSILLKSFEDIWRKKSWKIAFSCSSALIFVTGLLWDHGYYLGINHGPMLLPIALVFSIVFFSLHLFEDVEKLYLEKDNIRKKADEFEALKNTNQTIVKTVMAVAHDVRKPMSMIEAFLPLLHRISSLPELKEVIRKYEPSIKDASKSVKNVLKDALYLGPNRPLELKPTNLISVFDSSLRIAMTDRIPNNIRIDYTIATNPIINVDYFQIERVFVNILNNALDAMGADNSIHLIIESESSDGTSLVKIIIRNSGSYIDPEKQARIFDTFYSEKSSGFGLGLSICNSIILNHGGTISCSSSKDLGTMFEILLPQTCEYKNDKNLCAPNSRNDSEFKICPSKGYFSEKEKHLPKISSLLKHKDNSGAKLKILLIDDEEIYCERVRQLIGASYIFNSVSELSIINNMNNFELEWRNVDYLNYDIIIIDRDLGLTTVNGLDVLKYIKNKSCAVLCLHSNRISNDDYKLEKIEIDSILPKPVDESHMLELLYDRINPGK